ncbi:MAG: glycosyltransferase [Candidatus Omnitrophota bacterium]
MWILIFMFFLSTFILGWALFGYCIWIFLLGVIKKKEKPLPDTLTVKPPVSLVVPTYNEEDFILKKIENIKALDYPEDKLQVLFVDGGSSDKTLDIIESNKSSCMNILRSDSKGKINQVNFALKECKGDFIFITDTDGMLSSNCVIETLKEFARDDNIRLVGVYSSPKTSYGIDGYYWLTQNKARLLESQAFSSSIVIAICYCFNKGLIEAFPDDVIADDIYISYLANYLGHRVSYIDTCYAQELRGPENIKDFISHKFRKSNAFLRETLRFLYKVSDMPPEWKAIFLTKISQLIFIPWMFASYIVLGGALVSLGRWDVFFISNLFLLILFVITSRIFSLIRRQERYSVVVMGKTFLLSMFILFIVGISFIFFRQSSSYRKINAK